ncbi:MAG: heme o synthase [Pseudomonadota bacterium]
MTDISAPAPANAASEEAGLGDYVKLLKPRVMSLVVFTALAGIMAAPGDVHPILGFAMLLCIAVGAGAAGALNMWYDADIDAQMARTVGRPVPTGRVEPGEALALGIGLSLISVPLLALFANLLAALFLAFTIFFYAVVYTIYLKRSTPQNIVIGGLAGAFPPAIGWLAVTGELSAAPVLMVMIIFLWTPPHFWALALFRTGDYARVDVPMMPVVAGAASTRRQIFWYSVLMTVFAILPAFTVAGGPIYLVVASLASARFLLEAWRVGRRTEEMAKADSHAREKRLFGISIAYLFAIFGAMIADAVLRGLIGDFGWPVWL